MPVFKVEILKKADKKTLAEINHLTAQLSLSATAPKPMILAELKQMLAQKDFYQLVIRSKGAVVAGLNVYITRIPTGLIAEAEDLVVDEPYRMWGLGRVLMEKAIEIAKKHKAKHISHRTSPKRVDANRLYQEMGFKQMETNFYRINLDY
ncbi:MAG: GNAT family N-acetyltransferase [Patescibacteria group bacterium]